MTLEELEKELLANRNTVEKLENRLRTVEDIEAIKKLQTNYVNHIQRADYDTIEEFFTEEATFIAGKSNQGKADIGRRFREDIGTYHLGKEGCVLIQPVINVDGDKATGTWTMYFLYAHPHTRQSLFWVLGYYDMEYTRVNGQWKISYLKHTAALMPPGGPPRNDEFLLNFLPK